MSTLGGTVKVEWLGMKMRKGRLRWYGHMKGDGNEVTRRKRGRPKGRFLDVVKEDMGEVGAREKGIGNRMLWRNIIWCGNL